MRAMVRYEKVVFLRISHKYNVCFSFNYFLGMGRSSVIKSVWFSILSDHGAGSYYRAMCESNSRKNNRTCSNPYIILNYYFVTDKSAPFIGFRGMCYWCYNHIGGYKNTIVNYYRKTV